MADIFVSYARADKARVAPLVAALERQGWSVWWDPAIIPGQEFDSLIRREIDAAKVIIVVWTPSSVESRWVRGEARIGADRSALVPVRFDAARLPIDAMAIHTTDLDDWKEDPKSRAFQELLSALMVHLKDVARASAETEKQISICVLPFANMSDDAQQEYFSDGISEDIITDLSKVSALMVISRNSAFTFKGRHVDVPEVARQLKVTHVLEGSVRKSGNRVRINAQLINGATNGHVWAERWDRDLADIFALQDEISEAIVSALKLKLFPEEKQAIEDRGTNNVEAYDIFLRARSLSFQLGRANLERAAELLRKALVLDPQFVPALGMLNQTLGNYRIYVPERWAEIVQEMDANSTRISALAPNSRLGLMARAAHLIARRDFLGAERVLEAAQRGSAAPLHAPNLRAWLDDCVGRFDEAIKGYRESVRQDPLSVLPSVILQQDLHIAGRDAEAQVEWERCHDLSGGDKGLLESLALARMWNQAKPEEIRAQYRRMLASASPEMRPPLAEQLEPVLFDPPAARALIRRAFDDPLYQNGTRITELARAAARYDDTELALAAMQRGYVDMGFVPLRGMWEPELAQARKDPRFKEILRDLGLVDYWRGSGKWGDFVRPLGDDDFEIIR